jgi:outer membrane protein assembly factor BamB
MTRSHLLLAALLVPALFAPAAAQEWPRFRGPNGSGIGQAHGLPVTWTERDYRWRVELPGVGHSSPVVNGDRLFITSGKESDGTLILQCLNVVDGHPRWTQSIASKTFPKNASNSYGSSTPALDATRLYLAWATTEHYYLAALDQQSGRELWRNDLGPYDAEHGFGVSPMLVGDLVIAANEQNGPSSVQAFDCATGKQRWKAERRTEKTAYATPCLFQPAKGPVELILASWAHGVYSLDPLTGRSNWELPVFKLRVVGSPLVAGGLVFGHCKGGAGKQMCAVRPPAGKDQKPEIVYDLKRQLPYATTPVADEKRLYLIGDDGIVSCRVLADGKLLWQERTGLKFFGSPILACGRVYCIARDGQCAVLAAGDRYELLAKVNLGEPSHSTPAVAGNVLYLRTVSHLMALPGKP